MDAPAFALTETHRQFRDTLRRFAEDRVAPNAAKADREATYPQKSYDACVELELPSLGIPVEYGGAEGRKLEFDAGVVGLLRIGGLPVRRGGVRGDAVLGEPAEGVPEVAVGSC